MKVIIDSDSPVYSLSSKCVIKKTGKLHPLKKLYSLIDQFIESTVENTFANDFEIHLTGNDYIRRELCPLYKANRKDKEKPQYYDKAREYLIKEYNAQVSEGTEADDEVCIRYNEIVEGGGSAVVAHIDKDIDQLPGIHYNWNKDTIYTITPEEGDYSLYIQSLTGDPVDNIKALVGLGKKAVNWLEGVERTPLSLYERCLDRYVEVYGDQAGTERLNHNMQLLYLHRKEGDQWEVPYG